MKHWGTATFFSPNDAYGPWMAEFKNLRQKYQRWGREDRKRLRAAGDLLPHIVYANPALVEMRKRGITMADLGRKP